MHYLAALTALSLLVATSANDVDNNSNNNGNSSDVVEKVSQLVGVHCASLEECADLLSANSFQMVLGRLAKYNVTAALDNKTDIATVNLPSISLPPYNLTGNQQAERGIRTLASFTSVDVETLKKANDIYKVDLENFKIRTHGLHFNLSKDGHNAYSVSFNATSINVTFSVDVSGGGVKLLSAPFSVSLISPLFNMHAGLTTVKDDEVTERYLQVSSCSNEIDYSKFLLSTKEMKLVYLTQFANNMMDKFNRKTLGEMFCRRYQPKLNELLRSMAHRSAHPHTHQQHGEH